MATQALVERAPANRWLQLSVGVVCMVMIANLQYGWTYFVNPMKEANNWALAAIQVAFSLFVLTETWLIPIEGWFVDKFGAEEGRHGGRRDRCRRLDSEQPCNVASIALRRGDHIWRRRRLRLWPLCRECVEVVC